MIHDIPDPDWMLRNDGARDRCDGTAALRFDALVRPPHLTPLRRFRDRHPDLPIVIDHFAKPRIAEGIRDPWADDLACLAREANVFRKLSGMATEAGEAWRNGSDPLYEHVIDRFAQIA